VNGGRHRGRTGSHQARPEASGRRCLEGDPRSSKKIDGKYATYLFETTQGQVISGVVLKEEPLAIQVIEDPIAKTKPVALRPTEIAERKKSPTSIMPQGLPDKLTREDILDLIAYIVAKGDSKHKLFQGGHDHHGGR
jgi:hypothetical protein